MHLYTVYCMSFCCVFLFKVADYVHAKRMSVGVGQLTGFETKESVCPLLLSPPCFATL